MTIHKLHRSGLALCRWDVGDESDMGDAELSGRWETVTCARCWALMDPAYRRLREVHGLENL